MRPIFYSFGPVNITWYMAFGVTLTIIGYILLKIIAKNSKLKKELEDYYFLELIAGFIGARIVYVIFNLSLYKDNLSDAIRINHYNLNFIGGIVVALLVLYISTKIKKQDFIEMLNYLVIPFYFAMAIGVWSLEFEGVLSNISQIQTLMYSIIFILALILHSLLQQKNRYSPIIILIISLIGYYGISIYY